VQTEEVAFTPAAGGNLWLRSGKLTYRMGRHAIQVGPGADVHRLAHTHSAGAVAGCFRVAIALTTPVSQSLEIRYGRWSRATRSIEVASLETVETPAVTDTIPIAQSFVRI